MKEWAYMWGAKVRLIWPKQADRSDTIQYDMLSASLAIISQVKLRNDMPDDMLKDAIETSRRIIQGVADFETEGTVRAGRSVMISLSFDWLMVGLFVRFGLCREDKEWIRCKVVTTLALCYREKLRLLCHPRDAALHFLLLGRQGGHVVQSWIVPLCVQGGHWWEDNEVMKWLTIGWNKCLVDHLDPASGVDLIGFAICDRRAWNTQQKEKHSSIHDTW